MSVKHRTLILKTGLLLTALLWVALPAASQTSPLERGKELFLNDRMEEARPFLETALNQYPRNEDIYLYLATVYESLDRPGDASAVLQRGVEHAGEHLDVMYFNLGNNMFKQGKHVVALEMYTKALGENPDMSEAYLNRANTALRLEEYAWAVDDYETYLNLDPNSSQRESIGQVVAALRGILEERRQKALEEERKRREEEARRKALLNQVLNSLENASDSTTNLSAESEEVEKVEEEADIVE